MALIQIQTFSETLEFSVPITVVIPDGLDVTSNTEVVFLLHGYNGGHLDFIRYTNIEKIATNHKVIVVMPAINNSFYTNMASGPNYFDYLNIELPEIISKWFKVSFTNKNTGIIGISMGGYGALKAALTYHNKFKYIAGLSSVTDIVSMSKHMLSENRKNNFESIFGLSKGLGDENKLELLLSKENETEIYLTCGKDDFLYEDNLNFIKKLDENNIKYTFVSNEGSHNWDYWNENLINVFNYFYKN